MQVQKATAYPRFAGHENHKVGKGKPGAPLRNYATVSYTEVTPEFKKAQKAFLGLLGGSAGLMLAAGTLHEPLHKGLKNTLPTVAKKITPHYIWSALALASIGSFAGAFVKMADMSKHTQQFMLKNVDLHALRGGNAQQLQRLG